MARADTALVTLSDIPRYYLSYFDPRFLFFSGDTNPSHSPGDIGQLHFAELVFIPLGLWSLWRSKDR